MLANELYETTNRYIRENHSRIVDYIIEKAREAAASGHYDIQIYNKNNHNINSITEDELSYLKSENLKVDIVKTTEGEKYIYVSWDIRRWHV